MIAGVAWHSETEVNVNVGWGREGGEGGRAEDACDTKREGGGVSDKSMEGIPTAGFLRALKVFRFTYETKQGHYIPKSRRFAIFGTIFPKVVPKSSSQK